MKNAVAFGLTHEDLGNNEGRARGVAHHPQQGATCYLALTGASSRWFKTPAGAIRYLATFKLDSFGRRVASVTEAA